MLLNFLSKSRTIPKFIEGIQLCIHAQLVRAMKTIDPTLMDFEVLLGSSAKTAVTYKTRKETFSMKVQARCKT